MSTFEFTKYWCEFTSYLTQILICFVRTHLMGRILGAQGLSPTPIDTKGFQSVIRLIETVRMHILVLGQTCHFSLLYFVLSNLTFQCLCLDHFQTNADSFDLFYGLYKYNRNSGYTIGRLRGALDDVVGELLTRDGVVGVFDNGKTK